MKALGYYNRDTLIMRKYYLLFLFLLTSWFGWSQVNFTQDYENTAGFKPWLQLQGVSAFVITDKVEDAPCEKGIRSLRTNLIGKKESGVAILLSDDLGKPSPSNGGLIDFSFTYKWIVTDDEYRTAAPAEELKFKWQWANNMGGPWNTFLDIEQGKHIESADCQKLAGQFIPGEGSLFVRIVIENLTNTSNNTFYLDNLSIKQNLTPAPCKPVINIKVSEVTSSSFKAIWTKPESNIEEYDYEIRTSGLPGSGNEGFGMNGTINDGLTESYDFNNLMAGTRYKLYLKSKCSEDNGDSVWVFTEFVTLCEAPSLTVPEKVSLCGPQSRQISAFSTMENPKYMWFDSKGKQVGASANYTTPELFKSTNYTVLAGDYNELERLRVAQNSYESIRESPPLRNRSSKVQYIYTVDELTSSGAKAGLIKSVGFILKEASKNRSLTRNNFSIYIGKAEKDVFGYGGIKGSANSVKSQFIPNEELTLVKEATSYTFVPESLNMIDLDHFFEWDGFSNLVVEIIYAETDSSVSGGDIIVEASKPYNTGSDYDDGYTPYYWRTVYTNTTKTNLKDFADVTAATGVGWRPNIFLNMLEGCGTKKNVEVEVYEPPLLELDSNHVQTCTADGYPVVTVLNGAKEYDNFEWIPSDGVTGDERNGWIFSITETKEYTLRATRGNCVNIQKVLIEINPSSKLLELQDEYNLCYDYAQELIASDIVNDIPTIYDFNSDISKATLRGAAIGDEIVHDKNLSANNGSGSLHFKYSAQTMASVSMPVVNLFNLEGIEIEFDHIAAMQATGSKVSDFGYLEYSTNNGTSWKRFDKSSYEGEALRNLPIPTIDNTFTQMFFTQTSYPEWQSLGENDVPTNDLWKHEKLSVPSSEFKGEGTFIVRFRIGSDASNQYRGWYIDNVKISTISRDKVIWEPIDNLYLDKDATIPYDGTINVGKVYLMTSNNNITDLKYKVSIERGYNITKPYSCTVFKEFDVNVGLYELPTVKDLTNCGVLNVADTGFGKNENGELKYYVSNNEPNAITQIVKSGIYYVEQIISGCRTKRVPFTVVINEKATEPILNNNQIFCGAAIVSDIVFEEVPGLQMKWFKTAEGGVELDKATSLETGVYYAEFNNGVCKSQRVAVNITIGTRPQPLVTQDVSTCGTTTISDVVIPSIAGAKVNWYKNDTDTKALATTTVLNSGVYYVAQQLDGCESVRKAINVTTIQNLTAPQSVAQTFCGSALVSDLVADGLSGAVLNWYNSPTSPSSLAPGTKLASGTYYVSQTVGTCVSPRKAINVKILSINAPVIAPIYVCGTANVTSLGLQTTGQTYYRVYALKQGGVEMGQNDVIKTGTYYISKVESGCESQRATVQVTVTPRPNAPTGNTKQSFNDYAEVSNLKMNEAVIWFDSYNDAVNNTNALPAKTALQNNKTYYAVIEGPNGCTSLPTAVTVTIVLGLNDLDLASLKYYPNPADSELTVSYKEPIRSIEIYDILGKQIKRQKFETNEVRLDVSRLSSGTYMLKVQTDSGSQFVKIVKK